MEPLTDKSSLSPHSLSKGDGGGVTQWQTLDGEGDNEAEITRSGCLKTHTLTCSE